MPLWRSSMGFAGRIQWGVELGKTMAKQIELAASQD